MLITIKRVDNWLFEHIKANTRTATSLETQTRRAKTNTKIMRGLQWLLVCAFIYVQVKHSFSTVEIFFDSCVDNQNCPDHAVCASATPTTKKCKCESGFDAIDMPFTSAGSPVTVCRGKL